MTYTYEVQIKADSMTEVSNYAMLSLNFRNQIHFFHQANFNIKKKKKSESI